MKVFLVHAHPEPRPFCARSNPDHLVHALERRHNNKSGTMERDIAAKAERLIRCDLLFPRFAPLYSLRSTISTSRSMRRI
jgi:hypothetical protein